MPRPLAFVCVLIPILLASCATGPPFKQRMQPTAVEMAVRRGAFEMNCPAAKGEVLSSEMVAPVINTFAFTGPERAEYTVGVAGCGKRTTYVVICPDNGGDSCFAGGSRTEVQK